MIIIEYKEIYLTIEPSPYIYCLLNCLIALSNKQLEHLFTCLTAPSNKHFEHCGNIPFL